MKTQIARSTLLSTDDLKWKEGFVSCRCGWTQRLGNGFNGYHIDICPDCAPELTTFNQRKVITGNPKGNGLTASIGSHIYFVIENGIHIQFSKSGCREFYGLTEKQADNL